MANASRPIDAAGDAWLALRLFVLEPAGAGGICVRSAAGPVRDRWLADLRAALAPASPWRPIPGHVDVDRLLGGLDLAATLRLGRSVAQRGLLAEAHGGVAVLAMAERSGEATVAHIAAALDSGEVVLARHGIEQRNPARFGVVALDEGADEDEQPAESLLDRLAFRIDLNGLSVRDVDAVRAGQADVEVALVEARAALADVRLGDDMLEAICAAAVALGVRSMRVCVLAARVARAAAALAGRSDVAAEDAAVAARLVLAPRATQVPTSEADGDAPADEMPSQEESQPETDRADDESPSDKVDADADAARDADPDRADRENESEPPPRGREHEATQDQVLAAAAAAIPRDLLARLALGGGPARRRAAGGRAGALQAGQRTGRPQASRRELPRGGGRLDLIATLRAAAPWQRLREREAMAASASLSSSSATSPSAAIDASRALSAPPRIRIRTDDFHVARRIQRGRTTTIFAVDASGSSALQRLAETKGAVELLLAECYVRRDSVAVIAFRGRGSELLLSPTRSLVRAKRSLAELPGGGGTPLAAGIDAALALALAVRRRGDTPVIVVLTDGRANVARDGSPGRAGADVDALLSAKALRGAQISSLLIDTSSQPQVRARDLAAAMEARYLPLPHAGASTLSEAVRIAGGAEASRSR